MHFNECIGLESSEREYKIGVIYWSRDISFQDSLKLLMNGQWIFNTCIFNTIVIYIRKYLCKYIASFTNRLSSIDNGELYIGVDDNGFIKGIPYQGILTLDVIRPLIESTINEMLLFSNNSIRERLKDKMKIEIINIRFRCSYYYVKESKEKINDYIKFNKEKEDKIEKYSNFKKMWVKLIEKQQIQIHKCIDKERFQFLNYCKEKGVLRKKDYNHKYSRLEYLCDVPNYYDMIANIKIKKFERQRDGSIVTYPNLIRGENTDHRFNEINDVIALYNFGRYKDFCLLAYRNMRLNHPSIKVDPNYPKFLLSQIETMVPIWMKKNKNINLYVIKVTIPSGILKEGESISYFNVKKRKYEQCFRSESPEGPITISVS